MTDTATGHPSAGGTPEGVAAAVPPAANVQPDEVAPDEVAPAAIAAHDVSDVGATGMFASLRVYNYRLYFFGQAVSVAGNWMQNVAIGWAVLQLSHSGVVLGAVTAARFVPLILLGPWGGLISDRSDKLRVLLGTQISAAVLSLTLALLSLTSHVSISVLIAIVASLGLVNVFDSPSRQSLISNMVGRDRIANAVALNSIAVNSSRIIGPGVGGVLIATLGVTPCFFFNAASYGAVIVSLLAMRKSELLPSKRERRSKGQIRAGLRYIVGTPALLGPLVMVTVAGTFAWEFPVTLPLLTSSTFRAGPAAYGTMLSCLAVGAIVGALVAARRKRITVRSLSVSAAIWGALILAAAAAPTIGVAFVIIAFVGLGAVTFNSAGKTLLQLASASEMRGRVMAVWSMAWQGSTVVGAPIVGAAAALAGARASLVVGGVATLAIGVYYVFATRRPATGRHATECPATERPATERPGAVAN